VDPGRSGSADADVLPGDGPDGRKPPSPDIGRCHTDGLSLAMTEDEAAASTGLNAGWLTLTNTSGVRCRVYGYPGLQLVAADGTEIPTTARRVVTDRGGPPTLVTVAPGGKVYAALTWNAQPDVDEPQQGSCQPRPMAIKVIPPDETSQLRAGWPGDPVCRHGVISVDAFQPGAAP
ncbi:DUF4232 domain-containing protein, partial [Micromonospora zhanjiangensis]